MVPTSTGITSYPFNHSLIIFVIVVFWKMAGAQTTTWDDVTWFHSSAQIKENVPTLGPRFLVKFPRVGKAIEVKCPTYARGPPHLGLNIDRFITTGNQLGCLPFTWKNRKFQLENQMVRIIPFGVLLTLLKLWASGQSNAFFTPFGIYSWCSYILHVIHLLLRQAKSFNFVFMPKISIRVVCVNHDVKSNIRENFNFKHSLFKMFQSTFNNFQ